MTSTSLQGAIDRAGSPIRLLWKPNPPAWQPPVLQPEFIGWRAEYAAAFDSVALADLCHHMSDLIIEGPGAVRLLSEHSVNDYNNFAVGQAKQLVATTDAGHIINDGILLRNGKEKFTLTAVAPVISWMRFHAERGGYDVSVTYDPDSGTRGGGDPVLFRYQVQGPHALELVEQVFGGPLPETKFFHSTVVELGGRRFRALRHGMTGQPGYEFSGDWRDGMFVKQALLEAGAAFGLVQVGAMTYSLNEFESGWIPSPTPGIYDAPELGSYREWLGAMSFEGMHPLHGSFFSENIEDFYTTPYALGYGRVISFDHDFVGRDALKKARDNVTQKRVTLVLDRNQVRQVWGGPELPFDVSYGRYRVEADGRLIGVAFCAGTIPTVDTVLSLALVDKKYAMPGTEVTFVWGEHPGPGTAPDVDLGFSRIRATVQPSPYNEFTRTGYRDKV